MSARRGFNPLKILVSSHLFHPSVGGLEEVSRNLAAEFVRQGNEVKLVTQTPGVDRDEFPFEIVRHPSGRQLRALTRWCDVLFHNNISLQTAWPLLVTRRPWIITHAIWTSRVDGAIAWQDRLKRFLFRFATNIAISQAIADALPVASLVIGNPFRRELFRLKPTVVRDRDLVFLGRLVSDKGVDLLLRALGDLKQRNVSPNLTIIGDGPEERRGLSETCVSGYVPWYLPMAGLRLARPCCGQHMLARLGSTGSVSGTSRRAACPLAAYGGAASTGTRWRRRK